MKFILAVLLPMARYSRLDQQKPKQLFVFIKCDDIGQFKSDVTLNDRQLERTGGAMFTCHLNSFHL